MKKMIAFMMAFAVAVGVSACGSAASARKTGVESRDFVEEDVASVEANMVSAEAAEQSETVVIEALNGRKQKITVQVPYDPQRVAVLDMAALDVIDALGVGERVVGSAAVSIEYLKDYDPDDSDGAIMNLGTIKNVDLEKVAASQPDIIFIGGRLSTVYEDLEAIAPVVYLSVDYEKGIVESTRDNAEIIASIFGKEEQVNRLFTEFAPRIDYLKKVLSGKEVLLGMYNSNALSLMDDHSQLNLIVKELGARNLGSTVGETEKASHGEEASWETIVSLDPEYLFILDRSTAVSAQDEGVMGAREVVENGLMRELDVYKEGNIIYFIQNANVWYTATGGVQALDIMLADLEMALGLECEI